MRSVLRLVWVFALCVFFIGGCNQVYTAATLELAVTGTEFVDGEWVNHVLEGAELCQTDTGNCALSDEKGRVTIELPVDEEISYTLEKEGYGSYLTPDFFTQGGESSVYARALPSDDHNAVRYERVDSPYPMRFTGTIFISTNLEGVTFDLRNATGKPFYSDEQGLWNPDLTETTSWRKGGFTEVTPGEYRVTLGGAAQDLNCLRDLAWPSNEPNTIRLEVREGYTTRASMTCPVP